MAHNIFHTGAEWFEDTIIDPVKEKAEEIVKDYKINQIKKEFKKIPSAIADGFVTHDKLTPELIEQGWKEGLDGQPYNANLVYTADDWARDQANAGRHLGSVHRLPYLQLRYTYPILKTQICDAQSS